MTTAHLTTTVQDSQWSRFKHCLGDWRRHMNARHELATLSERIARDIGIERTRMVSGRSGTFRQL